MISLVHQGTKNTWSNSKTALWKQKKQKKNEISSDRKQSYKVATIDDPNFDLFNFKRQITIMEKWNSSFDGFTFNKSCHFDQCFNTTLCKMSVYIMFNHYMRHVYLTVWPALRCLMIQVQHDLLFSCNFFSMLTTHVHMYFLEVTFSKLCCAPVKTFRHLSKGANGRISHIRTDKEMKYVNCKNAQLLLSR